MAPAPLHLHPIPSLPEAVEDFFPDAGERSPGKSWPIQYRSVEALAIVVDFTTIALSSVLTGVSYHLIESGVLGDVLKFFGSAILVSVLFVSLMSIRGLYKPTELLTWRVQIRAVCLTWIGVFLLLTASVFALKIGNEISRGSSMLFAAIGLVALIANRRVASRLLTRGLAEKRFSGRNIVLITDLAENSDLGLEQSLASLGLRVRRHFILPLPGADFRFRQNVAASVIDYVRGSDVEEVILGADSSRWTELRVLAAELRVLPFPVSFIPLGPASEIFSRPVRELGDTVCVELQRGPLTPFERAAKRCVDVVVAAVTFVLLLPMLTIVALAIKLDSPGPILFKQQRCGFNGKRFQIYKFRTMSVLEDGPSIVQAQIADKRITHLGALLRKTSIDELPQLLNVLEGTMSLIGPRPHAVAHDDQFNKLVRNYAFRRRVKPGLTGWAQINGCRGPTPTTASIERRVEHDLWYIDNWSLRLDFTILFLTPLEILWSRHAF
jgi:putative colanic acid biosysnthesis UDP-glucose lipid carrier transferase